jgi:hypothetical protein
LKNYNCRNKEIENEKIIINLGELKALGKENEIKEYNALPSEETFKIKVKYYISVKTKLPVNIINNRSMLK